MYVSLISNRYIVRASDLGRTPRILTYSTQAFHIEEAYSQVRQDCRPSLRPWLLDYGRLAVSGYMSCAILHATKTPPVATRFE
jgi:hypothetical protein